MSSTDHKSKDMQQYRVKSWYLNPQHYERRFIFDLNSQSVYFDLGGYKGEEVDEIYRRYGCYIYVFEPVAEYASFLQQKYKDIERIKVFAFGLSDKTEQTSISLLDNSSSVFKQDGGAETIQLVRISEFISQHNIEKIDLMKINIEGSEYPVLEDLIKTKLINRVENVMVQFHDFVDDAEARMLKIEAQLKLTHYLTYRFKFVWENWAKRKDIDQMDQPQLKSYVKKLQRELDNYAQEFELVDQDAVRLRREIDSLRLPGHSQPVAPIRLSKLKDKLNNIIKH